MDPYNAADPDDAWTRTYTAEELCRALGPIVFVADKGWVELDPPGTRRVDYKGKAKRRKHRKEVRRQKRRAANGRRHAR